MYGKFNPELEIDYDLANMPNGEFVGECYYLTHDVIEALGATMTNEQFIAAETAIREYVWKAAFRAYWQNRP